MVHSRGGDSSWARPVSGRAMNEGETFNPRWSQGARFCIYAQGEGIISPASYCQRGNWQMAWFSPPLYKPGIHKCPRCGDRPWPWRRGAWVSEWRCPNCQSLLKWERSRYYAAFFLCFLVNCADTAAIVWWPHRPEDRIPVTGLVGILAIASVIVFFIFWWMASISLVEEPVDSPPAADGH